MSSDDATKTNFWLKYFVHNLLWKQSFASNSSQIPSILVTLKPLVQPQPKLKAPKLYISAKNCFT